VRRQAPEGVLAAPSYQPSVGKVLPTPSGHFRGRKDGKVESPPWNQTVPPGQSD
ncbi:hypothetical protein HPB47_024648, partial [Ixodes persulcatus]